MVEDANGAEYLAMKKGLYVLNIFSDWRKLREHKRM